MNTELVQETWEELGFRVRARGYYIWVRTLPFPRKIGSIWMPPKLQQFYGELPHLVTIRALVLSAGNAGLAEGIHAGETIFFKRLHFAEYRRVGEREEQQRVGWVNANDVMYKEEISYGGETAA